MDYIEFYNGNQMPMLGLGTFRVEMTILVKKQLNMLLNLGIVA